MSHFSVRRSSTVKKRYGLLAVVGILLLFAATWTGLTRSKESATVGRQSHELAARNNKKGGVLASTADSPADGATKKTKKSPAVSKKGNTREKPTKRSAPLLSFPSGGDQDAALRDRVQQQEWEINYLRNVLNRKGKILEETHDEMLKAFDRLRDALHEIGSAVPSSASDAPELPCHCLEQSAMAPQDIWCDNHRSRVSGAHVCVLRDVCFGDGEQLVVLSPRTSDEERRAHRMQIARVDQSLSVVFSPKPGAKPSPLYEKISNTVKQNATLVVYASQFANHITHVLEGAGGLHFSVHRNKEHVARHVCPDDDLTCFPPVAAFNFMGSGFPGEWHENMLRIMIEDHDKAVVFRYSDEPGRQPFQCFKRAIVPGFYYSVFPDSEDTSTFQAATREYLTRNANYTHTAERAGVILMSKRTSKRSVVDWDKLVDFVKQQAALFRTAGGKTITVKEIEYGREAFAAQASSSAEADILMGLHGADLTNMLYQRRGSVILELNPLFFFENRFYELANNLGLHYMAWTCTHTDCAFGGNEDSRFRSTVSRFGYNFEKRVFERDGRDLKWPYDRYVGYSCPACDAMGINVMEFRDTNVRVEESLNEIQVVLHRAFSAVGFVRK